MHVLYVPVITSALWAFDIVRSLVELLIDANPSTTGLQHCGIHGHGDFRRAEDRCSKGLDVWGFLKMGCSPPTSHGVWGNAVCCPVGSEATATWQFIKFYSLESHSIVDFPYYGRQLWNRADNYIFILWFLLLLLSSAQKLLTCDASSHTPPGVQISKPYYISIDLCQI